jgi:Uma2 family endonuclease
MGMQEYWIIDYLGSGGRRFIGNPKQPTFSVYQLIDGEYQVKLFREGEGIESQLSQNWSWQRSRCSQQGTEEAAYADVRVGVSD